MRNYINLGLLMLLIGGYIFVSTNSFNKGVESERIRLQKEHVKILKAQRETMEKQFAETQLIYTEEAQQRLEREKSKVRTEYVTQEVIKYVDKEIYVEPACDALADHVVRVFEQATELVRSTGYTKDSGSD